MCKVEVIVGPVERIARFGGQMDDDNVLPSPLNHRASEDWCKTHEQFSGDTDRLSKPMEMQVVVNQGEYLQSQRLDDNRNMRKFSNGGEVKEIEDVEANDNSVPACDQSTKVPNLVSVTEPSLESQIIQRSSAHKASYVRAVIWKREKRYMMWADEDSNVGRLSHKSPTNLLHLEACVRNAVNNAGLPVSPY